MRIDEQRQGAVLVLRLDGPLTGEDAEHFKTRLLKALDENFGRFVLDVSQIPFVDSRGLEVLVEVNEKMVQGGQSLKLCAINDTLRRVLELTDLSTLFEHFEDTNVAVRSFL